MALPFLHPLPAGADGPWPEGKVVEETMDSGQSEPVIMVGGWELVAPEGQPAVVLGLDPWDKDEWRLRVGVVLLVGGQRILLQCPRQHPGLSVDLSLSLGNVTFHPDFERLVRERLGEGTLKTEYRYGPPEAAPMLLPLPVHAPRSGRLCFYYHFDAPMRPGAGPFLCFQDAAGRWIDRWHA